jgi:tetratricopeptide (TPR) repeat protein
MSNPSPLEPRDAQQAAFHHQEALRLASSGQLREALKHFEIAARLEPQNPVWQYNRGLAFQQLRELPKAISAYQDAVRLAPDFFDAWHNLSAALKIVGNFKEAIEASRKAIALRPQAAGAHLNLGNALKAQGSFDMAESAYRTALAVNPADPRIYLNLSNTLRELHRMEEAIALLRSAVQCSPNFAEAHRDLAFALLLMGDLQAGFAENEWRWKTDEMSKRRRALPSPTWNGEDLSERTLFVYTEQGYGDAIQFARYIKVVADKGARVILECQQPLTRLLATVKGVSRLLVRGDPVPPADFHLPLLSCPRVLGTTLNSIPNEVPYLKAPGTGPIAQILANESRVKVGLVWAGNPSHENDANRSLPYEALSPLLGATGTAFYSLQLGEQAIRRASSDRQLVDLTAHVQDFADTAAVIEQLDLVVTVDTAVAHLAGALGKKVWLLLPFAPDWRWLLHRSDSPWYPTMRLFRQERSGDWNGVIQSVLAELALASGSTTPTD